MHGMYAWNDLGTPTTWTMFLGGTVAFDIMRRLCDGCGEVGVRRDIMVLADERGVQGFRLSAWIKDAEHSSGGCLAGLGL